MKKSDCVIYIANTKDADSDSLYEAFGTNFEPKRIDRIQRSSNEKVKRNQILTGTLLLKALEDYGVTPGDIDYGSFEKPYIKGRKDLFFNVSHSGEYIIVAVSGSEIGADIQKPSAYNENLVKKICSPKEREQRESEIIKSFNRIWALKESFSKLKSDGILMDFTKVTYSGEGTDIKLFHDGSEAAVAREVSVPDGYALFVSGYRDFSISKIINVCL